MGRVKTTAVKNLGDELIMKHGDKFTVDFEKNKTALSELIEIKSKKTRNLLAGYIAKKMQSIKKTGI